MTWDVATNLAAVARGGACTAPGQWEILRTYRVMGWGKGGKRLYRSCTWREGGRGGGVQALHPLQRTTVSCHGIYFHQCHHCCSLSHLKWTSRGRTSLKTCSVSSGVVTVDHLSLCRHTPAFFWRSYTCCATEIITGYLKPQRRWFQSGNPIEYYKAHKRPNVSTGQSNTHYYVIFSPQMTTTMWRRSQWAPCLLSQLSSFCREKLNLSNV